MFVMANSFAVSEAQRAKGGRCFVNTLKINVDFSKAQRTISMHECNER